MAKIAINGFGRIGRSFFKAAYGMPDFGIVAINDLADEKTLKYLFKYDSVYGGYFTTSEKAKVHLDAGAKRVVITAPATGDVVTALVGVNDDLFKKGHPLTCNASCTTNSVAPVLKVLLENFGIKKAAMTTVHGYTATQKLVDGPDSKDPRRGRA